MNISTLRDYAHEYVEACKAEKEAKERKAKLRDTFIREFGEKAKTVIGKYTITTYTTVRPNIDTKRLAEEMPEVYEKYRKADIVTNNARVTEA